MAALKEIKNRIASVRSTLKITSAMKMVASARLHHVQATATALAEYERGLSEMLAALCASSGKKVESPLTEPHEAPAHAVIVAVSSDGSLCGAFNANIAKSVAQQVKALRKEGYGRVTVLPVGEKIAQAAVKAGYAVEDRFRSLAGSVSYDGAAMLADRLTEGYETGEFDHVVLVFNHFHSMGRQVPTVECFLPVPDEPLPATAAEYLCEPGAAQLTAELLPYTLRTRLYAMLLDSATAEHAARTIAMQTATDNAKELLDELSLTYNKRRQQAITDELADITPNN